MVRHCQQSLRLLLGAASWAVKVEQVANYVWISKELYICVSFVLFRIAKPPLQTSAELLTYFISGAGIDLSCLSIVEGKVCWDLYIDGLVVSSDGNLLDALGAAIKVLILVSFF